MPIALSGATTPAAAVTGAVAAAGLNAAVLASPFIPGNSLGVGGPDVVAVAMLLSTVAQGIKMHAWFHQNRYMVWFLLALGFAVCLAIWHDDLKRVVLNAGQAVYNAIVTYGALNNVGALAAGTDAEGK